MARPALQPEEVADFRERLCEVAMRLFAERGYGAVTLRTLAAELGCSYATPYRYFSGKEEIFAAVRELGFRRFADFLEASADGIVDPEARLRALGHGYLAFAREQPHALRIMFELDQPSPDAYPELQAAERRAWEVIHGAVTRAVKVGVINGSPDTVAHVFWAAIHGLAALHVAGKLALGRSADDLAEPMMQTLIGAHRPRVRVRSGRQRRVTS